MRSKTHVALNALMMFALMLCGFNAVAQTPEMPFSNETQWQNSEHSRSRLLIGDQQPDSTLLIGFELMLDQNYKTYWRTPGDSGFAPTISTQGSENIASVDARWPAPRRFTDAGGIINGYEKSLLLPILITPQDPSTPITLHFTIDYGVCHTQCIPTQAKHVIKIPALNSRSASAHSTMLGQALKRTPQKVSELELIRSLITNMYLYAQNGKQALRVDLSPFERDTSMFVEAPSNWVMGQPQRIASQATFFGARNTTPITFIVPIEYRPSNNENKGTFRITLLSSGAVYEVEQAIDLAPKTP